MCALTGQTVWLTRPAHQAGPWAKAIQAAGGTAICEPLLAIEPPQDAAGLPAALAAAESADAVIATSANAIASVARLAPGFAPAGKLYGVGATTAAALAHLTGTDVAQPRDCFTSEDLLGLPALNQVAGQRIVLLSGAGGRSRLADTLVGRGAAVDKIALYRRRACSIPTARLAELAGCCQTIVVTSGEALDQLEHLLLSEADRPTRESLLACQLVAPSMRVVKQGDRRLRWSRPAVILDRVSAEAVVAALARIQRGDRQ
ncbi:uroporphyrinogen-III synthase [Salinisphaera sp. T31B1]|uniref:uroporphyrinogen-III synthase n=1 Tax=Salinisphaera sp. T31B1 TaxID=727963 RepID=UPI00333E24DF